MHIEIWENLTENYEKLKYPCRVHEPKTMSCIWKKIYQFNRENHFACNCQHEKRQPRKLKIHWLYSLHAEDVTNSGRESYLFVYRYLSNFSKSAFPVINIERSRVRVFRVDWRVLKLVWVDILLVIHSTANLTHAYHNNIQLYLSGTNLYIWMFLKLNKILFPDFYYFLHHILHSQNNHKTLISFILRIITL